jgi:hypothetical protein
MTSPPVLTGKTASTGWWRRHWRWAMPLAVVVGIVAAVGAVWFALSQWAYWSKSSTPYQEAMRRARCNIELVQALGEPVQDGYLPAGSMHTTGQSQFVIALSGPRGDGRLFLNARRSGGQWDYPMLYVVTDGKEAIDLTALDDEEAADSCALEECRANGQCPLPSGSLGA